MKNKLLLLLIAALPVWGCDKTLLGKEDIIISLEENLQPPKKLDDGWDVSSMAAENINGKSIKELISQLENDPRNIHSLLIIKNNKLVAEAYFGGWHRDRLQSIRSDSKSITSTLIGIAIDKNKINSVQERVFDFFPEYVNLKTPKKNEIRLEHLLTMTAGLQWDQDSHPPDDPRNDEDQLGKSEDGFRYTLQKDVVNDPGVRFNYSSGNSDLLTGIIHHRTGMHADMFAEEYLFKPLRITKYGWTKNKNGFPNGAYGLYLLPRDMAKIGQLYLDSGQWKGNQVVSSQWIKKSTQSFIYYPGSNLSIGYGYQWWTRNWTINATNLNTFQAQGSGGQVICVIPDKKTVIVLTGNNYDYPQSQLPFNFLQGYILPALF